MPPFLALNLSLFMMAVLLWREPRVRPGVSAATWIPTLWILILGSRSLGQWLNLGSPITAADQYMEGNPFDRVVYLALMVAAFVVLLRRRISWGEIVTNNTIWVVFFFYCGLSILWSDFPGVAFRRWFKSIGDPLMVLVLLSEARPARAIEVVLRRVAYVLLPLSVVFIKYYPHLGRVFSPWGAMYHTGVTTNKNLLGYLLMVFGLFFICSLVTKHPTATADEKRARRADAVIAVVFLLMIEFLFRMANSQTAFGAFLGAVLVAMSLKVPIVRAHFGKFVVVGLIVGGFLQVLFDLNKVLIEGLGRDTTLTGRTDIWDLVIKLQPNPLLGAGFESFWLGDRLMKMWEAFPVFLPNQAHNGYLELYLNLGMIGLLLFVTVLFMAYQTVRAKVLSPPMIAEDAHHEQTLALVGVGFFVAYLLYNVTEATFKPLTLLFIMFLVVTIRCPRPAAAFEAYRPDRRGLWRPEARPVSPAADWNAQPSTLRTGHGLKPESPTPSLYSRATIHQGTGRWRQRVERPANPKPGPGARRGNPGGSSSRESSLQWRGAKIRQNPE